jgi:hypothetical protein
MRKTMEDLYREVGPQGWYDDQPGSKTFKKRIEELSDELYEIDDELEMIAAEKEGLDEREEILLERANVIQIELEKLNGTS